MVLRRWAPGDVDALEGKLDAVGYGFFIPVFFVSSGMSLDLGSIADAPALPFATGRFSLVEEAIPLEAAAP